MKRIEEGNDRLEEMAILHIGIGRYGELISDIKKIQETINKDNLQQFLADLKKSFVNRGYIGLNPKRAEENTRKFLQSERQIMKRAKLFEMNGRSFFFEGVGFKFVDQRVQELVNKYYDVYGEKNLIKVA